MPQKLAVSLTVIEQNICQCYCFRVKCWFVFSQEKELENLAAMDLELQKIAEKFNDNRRG